MADLITPVKGPVATRPLSIAETVRKNASKLKKWRELEARAHLTAKDDEAIARVYASLRLDEKKLSAGERNALRELERVVNNRFR